MTIGEQLENGNVMAVVYSMEIIATAITIVITIKVIIEVTIEAIILSMEIMMTIVISQWFNWCLVIINGIIMSHIDESSDNYVITCAHYYLPTATVH